MIDMDWKVYRKEGVRVMVSNSKLRDNIILYVCLNVNELHRYEIYS